MVDNLILLGGLASLVAGLASGLGGFLIFFVSRVSDKFLDASLGFSAGVMLAATSFSLIIPAIEVGGIYKSVIGIALGTLFMILVEKFMPHMHIVVGIKGLPVNLSKLLLFILAITIHNFPEGLAIGVGFGGGDIKKGISLATGIGFQNIPEGLAVAFAILMINNNRLKAFWFALLTGLVEPIGGIIGVSVVSLGRFLLPYSLAFAGGAMLFVISEEIIPETHSRGNARIATIALILGFIIMMVLDNIFV